MSAEWQNIGAKAKKVCKLLHKLIDEGIEKNMDVDSKFESNKSQHQECPQKNIDHIKAYSLPLRQSQ
jgi:hypothetical protein